MALPVALMLAVMMLATSAVWLEVSIGQTRHAANVLEHLRAAQAADSALVLCARDLKTGVAPVLSVQRDALPEWTKPRAFDHPFVYEPVASWPGSVRPPQCLIEALPAQGDADASVYRITARGFGMNEAMQASLQLTIARTAGGERRAWRRIVVPRASR